MEIRVLRSPWIVGPTTLLAVPSKAPAAAAHRPSFLCGPPPFPLLGRLNLHSAALKSFPQQALDFRIHAAQVGRRRALERVP